MSKQEFVVYSEDKVKYKIIFEIKNEHVMGVTVNEENENILMNKIYQGNYTKEELSDFENTKLTFKDVKAVFEKISNSYNSNELSLIIKGSKIILSYFLFEKVPVSVNIPIKIDTIKENINNISLKISNLINFSSRYKHLFNKLSNNLSKNKSIFKCLKNENVDLKNKLDFNTLIKEQKERDEKIINLIQNTLSDISHQINLNTNGIQSPLRSNSVFPKKLEITKNIKENKDVRSLCILKDGRLASSLFLCSKSFFTIKFDGIICIYNKDTYQPDFTIKGYGDSVCVLKNGNLASYGFNGSIRIYEIDGNNYKLIHTIYSGVVSNLIELEDGKLCSSYYSYSDEKGIIKIWDSKYECIKTLEVDTGIRSIIEINNYIISSCYNDTLRIWDKSTYVSIQTINHIQCYSLSKLNSIELIVGGVGEISVLNISSFKHQSFKNYKFGNISSICVLNGKQILLGNKRGEIIYYDLSINQIIFTQKLHNDEIKFIIKTDDNKLISSSSLYLGVEDSYDSPINIYEWVLVNKKEKFIL